MGGAYTGSMLRQQPKRLTLMQKIRIKLRLDPPPKPVEIKDDYFYPSMNYQQYRAAMDLLVQRSYEVERKNWGEDTFGPA